jgi:predicted nucleotidyltransferase
MVAEPTLASVQNYLRALQTNGLPVRFGVVFGSQAKGQANQWSDIDLLVVSPQFDGPRQRRDVDLLWRLAARIDSRIEPIPCGERQWKEDTSSAIVEIARRDGQQVTP